MSDHKTLDHTITLDADKYDAVQIELMEERLILLSDDDVNIGEGSKKDCHLIPPSGDRSPLHRAFSVFLFHPTTGALLLQKRADEKITFPKMWTNTCCSHPLTAGGEQVEDGQLGVRRAAARKLEHELGIPVTKGYSLDDFAYLTRIHYYAKSDDVWAEHEIDYILFLTLDPSLDPSANEVSDTKWVTKAELEEFFKDTTNDFTPWFKLIAESFLYKWWDLLLASREEGEPLDAKRLIPEVAKRSDEMGAIIRIQPGQNEVDYDGLKEILVDLKTKVEAFGYKTTEEVIQEPNKVVVWIKTDGKLVGGSPFTNEYILIFYFESNRDRLVKIVEFMDSLYVANARKTFEEEK